ncbi:MAG TPA: metallophosphoesterase [Verrucomicrobiae bacterium]|nr:metallophosphoesterase [Verrucomicrobiae bacterium]
MRTRIAVFLAVVQSILFFGHWFVYETWRHFWGATGLALAMAFGALSVTFLTASLLARRYSNAFVRAYYTIAAVWLGFFSFAFLAACASWIALGAAALLRVPVSPREIAVAFLGLAALASAYGLLNSARTRVTQVSVKLPNLPANWRGRVAALVTDTHLGHVRGYHFAQRIVLLLSRFAPDIILIGGDLYDGTAVNARRLAAPLEKLSPPLGTYFIAGNHEEFGEQAQYLAAVRDSGVRVLDNEKVVVDGLQLVGVHHRDSVHPERFRAILRSAELDPERASILLTHEPRHLPIAAEEKIGLQLAGHTHAGQFFPFTWFTSRIYGPFVYGLKRLGDLLVYTSCGAGTWGPPMRVGTSPEIVLINFE